MTGLPDGLQPDPDEPVPSVPGEVLDDSGPPTAPGTLQSNAVPCVEVDGFLVYSAAPLVPVESIHVHPRNARQGDVGAVAESIIENGFYGECVVQASTGSIAIGNHRYLAAVQLGMTVVPALVVDVDDDTALRWMLADNRASDLAAYDDNALAELLVEVREHSERALVGTGFDDDALDQLLADLSTEIRPTSSATTVGERTQRFDESPLRQIILVTEVGPFDRATRILAEMLRRDGDLLTNTGAILHLLDAWAAAAGYDPSADADPAPATE